MAKIIKLKASEDITAVIDYLWENKEKEIVFLVPLGAALCQSAVSLKLLKREAEHLGKKIILVTRDEETQALAEQVGLKAKPYWPKEEATEAEVAEEEVLKEMPLPKFESLLAQQLRLKRQTAPPPWRVSDIRPASKKQDLGQKPKEFELEELLVTQPEQPESFPSAPAPSAPLVAEEILPQELEEYPIRLMSKKQEAPPSLAAQESAEEVLVEEKMVWPKTKSWSQYFLIPLFSAKFLILFTSAALIIAGLVLYFALPKAEIIIAPKSESLMQELAVVADKGITKVEAAENKIPAQSIKLEKKEAKEFLATGQRQLNEKARGVITVYNEYSSSPQGLVEKTRFVSQDGKVFRTTKSIVVPGAKIEEGKIVASSIEVTVVADQPGEAYNIGPGHFTIPGFQGSPKYQAFYGRSQNSMTGGATGLVKVVTQEDFDKAKAELWKSLQFSLDQEIRAQIPGGLKLLDNAFKQEISAVDSTILPGAPADKFTLTVKGIATALLFNEEDIFQLLSKNLTQQLGEEKTLVKEGSHLVYQEAVLNKPGESSVDFVKGRLSFKVQITGRVVWQVDVDELKKNIAGKNEQEIKQIFSQHQEIDKAKVLFWPFWVKSVPSNQDKIKIRSE